MKIGLYGGTFSPPHNGHRRIAEAFVEQCELDLLIVMPTAVPPHKAIGNNDPEKRLKMTQIAFEGCKNTVVSRLELDRGGASYTYDTLTSLYELYGIDPSSEKINFLCGTDMFLSLDTWNRAEDILRMVKIVCAPRGEVGEIEKIREKSRLYSKLYGTESVLLSIEPYPISSSKVRRMLANGEVPTEYISSSVYDYITKENLYDANKYSPEALDAIRQSVKGLMCEKRYKHTLSVEREAGDIADFVLPEKKAMLRVAALLHDSAKELSSEKQLNYIKLFDIISSVPEEIHPNVVHAAAAPGTIRELFPNYAEPEILSAVRFHTTGRHGMTLFDTVIFVADYTEKTRIHESCKRCRKFLHDGLEKAESRDDAVRVLADAALMSIRDTIAHLNEKGIPVDVNTLDAEKFLSNTAILK